MSKSPQTYSLIEAFDLLLKLHESHQYYIYNNLYEEVRIPYLSGPPGVGKTALTKNIAKCLEFQYNRIDMSQFEYYELKGLLYVDDKSWTTKIIELDIIPTEKCVLCIDEINAADYPLQKVIANLIYERQVVNRRLHDNTFIICCGNPQDTVEGMYNLLQHLQDRLIEISIQPTFDELLTRVLSINKTAYNIYKQNYNTLKKWFYKHKSLRQLTAASYPLEQYVKTNDEKWLELVRLHIPVVDEFIFTNEINENTSEILNIHDLLPIIINIDRFSSSEIQKLEIDKNILFNTQQYCQTLGLLEKWKSFLLKLDEKTRIELAEWLVGD
jgi:hypothetical protein